MAQTKEFGKLATKQAGVKWYLKFYSAVSCHLNQTWNQLYLSADVWELKQNIKPCLMSLIFHLSKLIWGMALQGILSLLSMSSSIALGEIVVIPSMLLHRTLLNVTFRSSSNWSDKRKSTFDPGFLPFFLAGIRFEVTNQFLHLQGRKQVQT